MPATDDIDVSASAATVAARYRRVERPLGAVFAPLIGALAGVAFLRLTVLRKFTEKAPSFTAGMNPTTGRQPPV
jgi:hypothetical protein